MTEKSKEIQLKYNLHQLQMHKMAPTKSFFHASVSIHQTMADDSNFDWLPFQQILDFDWLKFHSCFQGQGSGDRRSKCACATILPSAPPSREKLQKLLLMGILHGPQEANDLA